jgi:ribosome recycling factor
MRVECYGALTPMKQLGTITTPDARSIVITPWDKSIIGDIEKAILKSDIGISPTNDGKSLKLSMPPLTDERKGELDKILKKIAEDGRVSIRTSRHAAIEHVKKAEKDKLINEDEKFKAQEDIQKLTDKYTKDIDSSLAGKEKEIQL